MTHRQQALEDLLQGFLSKFGDTPSNKQVISSEISQFMKNKPKIGIKDLDELEELLLYKLNPTKKAFRKYSLSPIENKLNQRTFSNSPTLMNIKPLDYKNTTDSEAKELKKKVFNRKDNIIFPSEYIPEEFSTIQIKTITPKVKTKTNLDE